MLCVLLEIFMVIIGIPIHAKAIVIHNGERTHTHGQVMTLTNFNITNINVNVADRLKL